MTFNMLRPIREMPRDPALQTVVELVERLLAQAETPAQRAMVTRYIESELRRTIADGLVHLPEPDGSPLMQCCRVQCGHIGAESTFKANPRGRKYNAGYFACPRCFGSVGRWGNRYLVDPGEEA